MDALSDGGTSPPLPSTFNSIQRPGEIDPCFIEQMIKKELKSQSNGLVGSIPFGLSH